MTKFSPSEAALEGFRLSREQPSAILVWSLLYFVGLLAMGVAMNTLAGPEFKHFIQNGGMQAGDPSAYVGMLQHSWPAFVIVLVLDTFVSSVLTGGIFRMVLKPHDKGVAHMQLGQDEIRLAAVNLVMLAIGIFSFVIAATFATLIGGFPGVLIGFGLSCLLIWVGVRLILVTPMTFGEGRIAIIESWKLTEGHFWPLLGMAMLSIVFYVMVWALLSVIGLAFVSIGGGATTIAHPSHFRPLSALAVVLTLFIEVLIQTLKVIMLTSPLAVAYRELKQDDALKVGVWAKP